MAVIAPVLDEVIVSIDKITITDQIGIFKVRVGHFDAGIDDAELTKAKGAWQTQPVAAMESRSSIAGSQLPPRRPPERLGLKLDRDDRCGHRLADPAYQQHIFGDYLHATI